MKTADIMTTGVATVSADGSIAQAARIMLNPRVSGLPMVDRPR